MRGRFSFFSCSDFSLSFPLSLSLPVSVSNFLPGSLFGRPVPCVLSDVPGGRWPLLDGALAPGTAFAAVALLVIPGNAGTIVKLLNH